MQYSERLQPSKSNHVANAWQRTAKDPKKKVEDWCSSLEAGQVPEGAAGERALALRRTLVAR